MLAKDIALRTLWWTRHLVVHLLRHCNFIRRGIEQTSMVVAQAREGKAKAKPRCCCQSVSDNIMILLPGTMVLEYHYCDIMIQISKTNGFHGIFR